MSVLFQRVFYYLGRTKAAMNVTLRAALIYIERCIIAACNVTFIAAFAQLWKIENTPKQNQHP